MVGFPWLSLKSRLLLVTLLLRHGRNVDDNIEFLSIRTYLIVSAWWVWCMDEITIKTTNPKCRLYWCLIDFTDLRYSQSCWYLVTTPLVNNCRSNLLTGSPPLPPSLCEKVQFYVFIQCVTGGEGGIRLCGEHWQELCTVYFTRFQTYEIALPPNLEGEGASDR